VGISESASGGGNNFIRLFQRLGFTGRIYPVHPRASEVLGLRAYPSLTSIPEPIDLVVVSVPASEVPHVLEDCIGSDVRNVHVFTAGFGETGEEEGNRLEQRIAEIARRGGLRIIGPNCLGLHVPAAKMSIWDGVPRESGSVAFISQSGGHCLQITSYAAQYGIRFSKVISFGNGTVLDSTDFLEYLANDSETEIISLYIEGVRDGRRLLELVRDVNRAKPVIILKGGGTKPGSRAAASHTGSLAGDTAIWDAFFKQTGAVRVDYLDELVEVISTFSHLRPPRGNRVAVILGGGGYGVVAADSFAREGLDVPILDNETRRELSHIVPAAGSSVRNPLDIAIARYDLRLLQQIMEIVGHDPQIDIFVITYALEALYDNDSEQMHKLGPYICKFATEIAPHLAVVAVPDAPALRPPVKAEQRRLENVLPECGVPVYRTIPRAARALAKFAAYYKFKNER